MEVTSYRWRRLLCVVCIVLGGSTWCASAEDAVSPSPAVDKLRQIVSGSHRSDADKARDAFRHPVETLTWFGLTDNLTVVEVYPSSGWYADILAPFLKDHGHYVGANFPSQSPNKFFRETAGAFAKKMSAKPDVYGTVQIVEFDPANNPNLGPPASADMVLTFRNVHNWMAGGTAEAVFKAMAAVLKPGGTLGVVEHRASPDAPMDPKAKSGYVKEDYVIQLATAAGLQLVAKAEINANPKDTKDYPEGVWTLPPTLRLGEKDKDKYLGIGESDRMTLKFTKPASVAEATASTAGQTSGPAATSGAPTAEPSAVDIVTHCNNKYGGKDLRTRMVITNINKDGQAKKGIYRRFLRNYTGQPEGLFQKMILFSEFPPESRGLSFMRWEYTPESGKSPDQWLYSPGLRNVRRVSVRDMGESFLGSTLTLEDIGVRGVTQDEHKLIGIERVGLTEFYVVESIPKDNASMYSKRTSHYLRTPTWDECVNVGTVYYDRKGFRLKAQKTTWQKVKDAWVWQHVEVKNFQTEQLSQFDVDEVEVDVGVDEEMFNERTLKRGLR